MRIVRGFVLLSGIAGAAYAQTYQSPSTGSSNSGNSNQQLMDQATQYEQQQMQQKTPTSSDCSQLSQEEQAFASQLSDAHRSVFCGDFTSAQRVEAMALATPQAEGITSNQTSISPDEAVEIVMRNAGQNDQGVPDGLQQDTSSSGSYTIPSNK